MRLKDEFLVHIRDDETYIVPSHDAKFRGLIRGNEILGCVVRILIAGSDEEGIIRAILEEYDAPYDDVASDVRRALKVLADVGALTEE